MFRSIKNKKVAILSLISILFVSICLFPCGEFGASDAAADTHAGMHQGHTQRAESHSCHDAASGGLGLKQGGEHSCLHCDTAAPAATVEKRFHDLDVSYTAQHDPGVAAASDRLATATIDVKPPGSARPIFILNSTYII